MESIKELILVIQLLAGAAAAFRCVYLFIAHMTDEDKTIRNNKLRNTILATFLIEFVLGLGELVKSYYK